MPRLRMTLSMLWLLAWPLTAAGQTATATLKGVVADSRNQVVPGAQVALKHTAMGLEKTFTTDHKGEYVFTFVEPGTYQLTVKAQGFEGYSRQGLTLTVGAAAEVNVTLKPGSVSETLPVTANAAALETSNAALGTVIERKTIDDLPLNGRNPFQLVALAAGVVTTPNSRVANPGPGQTAAISINGGRALSNEVLLDGAPLTIKADTQPALRPSPDAVQEFKIVTNSYSAEYGRTGGGALNFSTRAGTNQFRGTLWEFFRNDALDATSFFSNLAGSGKEKLRFNQFGGNVGGPVLKNRLFFFANYEALTIRQSTLQRLNVPTAKMKRGDFSELLGATLCTNAQNQAGVCGGAFMTPLNVRDTNNNLIQARAGMIYTPAATAQRRVFAGNVILATQLNPVALETLAYYPDPNRAGLVNNFVFNEPGFTNAHQGTLRVDYNPSARQQIYGRLVLGSDESGSQGELGGSLASIAANTSMRPVGLVLDYLHTLSPRLVLHGSAGWVRGVSARAPLSLGFDPTLLGFPAYLGGIQGAQVFPTFTPTGYAPLGPPRNNGVVSNAQDTFSFAGDASYARAVHLLKAGGAVRLYRLYSFRADDPAGNFAFTRSFTARTPNDTSSGDAVASFLLGNPVSGRLGIAPALALQNYYFAVYAQDDWTLNRRLTINLGLRYESDLPTTERFNQLTNFDPGAAFPVNNLNVAFPASTGLGTRTIALRGAVINLGRNGNTTRGQSRADLNNLAPRLGLAFKLDDKTVVRAGAGIYFSPMTSGGASTSIFAVLGDLAETAYLATLDGGTTPAPGSSLSNPFPSGITQPVGAALGLLTGYGRQTLPVRLADLRNPYIGQWNLSVQRELPGQLLAEVAYTGSAGVGLLGSLTDLNQLPVDALALGAAVLQTTVANPFLTLPAEQRPPTGSLLSSATLTVAQLLRPYPQFGQIQSNFPNDGHSSYHALQAKLSRRFSASLSFQASYTFGKLIDNISAIQAAAGVQTPNFQDNNNRRLDKSISTLDARHRLIASASYALPVGQGQRWLKYAGPLNTLVGGWTANTMVQAQGGFPLAISATPLAGQTGLAFTALRTNLAGEPKLEGGTTAERISRWFNTAAFAQPASFTSGNAPRTLGSVRGPGYLSVNVGLHKNFAFSETKRLQFRAEAFNLFNRANFNRPNTTFGSANFGIIQGTEDPRQLQLALKFYF
jgi:hypothetical protein